MTRALLIISILGLAVASPAMAEDSPDDSPKNQGSYWSTTFQGGMLQPLGTMGDVHRLSLAGGGRIGWTAKSGLGIDLAAEYSPLSHLPGAGGETYEIHFVTAGLLPRFTLGRKIFRAWLAAGGGVAYEHTRTLAPMSDTPRVENLYAPAGIGAAGVELHLLSGLGVALIGSYTQGFGSLDYRLVNITGGLAFTFY